MDDEQFEEAIQLTLRGYSTSADKLRARDTAQREALARVEAERDAALAKAPTPWAYDQACRTLHKHRELANTAQALLREVDAYLSAHGDNAICNGSRLHGDIKDLLAGQLAVAGTTSDQYRAELYDEVWQKARDMGYGNVTDALVALGRVKATQPDAGEPTAKPDSSDTFYAGLYHKSSPMWHQLHELATSKGYDHVRYAIECAPVYKCDCRGARKVGLDLEGRTRPCECVEAANDAAPPAAAHGDAADTKRLDWLASHCDIDYRGNLPDGDYGDTRVKIDAAMRAQGDGHD